MSDETIPFPRPAGWQLSNVAAPECESVAGVQSGATSARILACMPDVHTVATIPISTPQPTGRDARWLSAGMSAKLLLGASALLVAVALVPTLFRSKEPADEQVAGRSSTQVPAQDMPPLWSGIPEAGPKVTLPGASGGDTSAQRADGKSKPTGAVASDPAHTGPTEKTPEVSIWPDPNRSRLPQRSEQGDDYSPHQYPSAPRMAGLPERYPREAGWPASSDGSGAKAGGAGRLMGQSNRPAALYAQRGAIDRAAPGPQSPAGPPAATGDVPWYEPWNPPETRQPAEPQYQARYQGPQTEPLQRQAQHQQSGYEQSQPRQPQYQQTQYQQPPYGEAEYRASSQQHAPRRPDDYPQYGRWENQPTSYQAPSRQASGPAQPWPPQWMPPPSVPPAQQSVPQDWQPQPTQQQYQWEYTPDYRRPAVPARVSPTGQPADTQRQPPYGPQSGAPAVGAPQPYAQQGYAQQWDERGRYEAQTYVPPQYSGQTAGYSAGRAQSSAALVDRTMPVPPNESGVGASRYTYPDASSDVATGGRYDGRGAIASGEARLGANTESVPARASYERAGPGTY